MASKKIVAPEGATIFCLVELKLAYQAYLTAFALELALLQALEGFIRTGLPDRNIGMGIEQIDFPDFTASQPGITGQSAKNVAGTDLGFLAAIDAQGHHFRL